MFGFTVIFPENIRGTIRKEAFEYSPEALRVKTIPYFVPEGLFG
jgi:hypothetical protein